MREPGPFPGRSGGGNHRGTRKAFGSIRRLPSKRYQARFTGPDGRTHTAPTTFDTKGDAQTWLDMQRADITRGKWLPEVGKEHTFRAVAERWLDRPKDEEYKPRTLAHYRKLLGSFLYPTFGDTPVGKITADDVDRWYAAFGKATPTYRAHAYSLLRSVMAYAVTKRLAVANPCQIEGGSAARRVKRIEPASLGELEAIAAAMPAKYRPMVMLSAFCALRFGELTELRRKDLDLRNGILHVRRGVVRADGQVIVGRPKTDAGDRAVAIPPHLIPMLREHRDRMPLRGPDALMFPASDGVSHIAPSSLYRVYFRARAAAGRPDLRWHDLRHTGATFAAQAGATLAELMARLGHSTPQAALIYQHAAKGRDAEIAAEISRRASQ